MDVELTEASDDAENVLISMLAYRLESVPKAGSFGLTGGYVGFYVLDSVQ